MSESVINDHVDIESDLQVLSEETLDKLCINDIDCWLVIPPPPRNVYEEDCDVNDWLFSVIEKPSARSNRVESPREANPYNCRIESSSYQQNFSHKSSRINSLFERFEPRSESKLAYEFKEPKLDTRTITKKKPSIFNRFSSTEELSLLKTPSRGNLYNNKLNLSSHNISGSNSNLNHTITYNNSPEHLDSTYTARKLGKMNNTFTMDETEKMPETPMTRRDQRVNIINGATIRKTEEQVKRKPLSMYAVYAEPTDSRPYRSTNSSMLSAYRRFKSSALNRQFTGDYRDEDILINNTTRYSPDYMNSKKTSTPLNNSVSGSRLIKRNCTFTCDKSLPRYNGSFIPKPK